MSCEAGQLPDRGDLPGWDEAAAQMPGNLRGDRDLFLAHIDRRDALVHDLHDGRLPARGVAAAGPPAEHSAKPRSFNFCGWSVVQRTRVALLLPATRTDPWAAGLSTAAACSWHLHPHHLTPLRSGTLLRERSGDRRADRGERTAASERW